MPAVMRTSPTTPMILSTVRAEKFEMDFFIAGPIARTLEGMLVKNFRRVCGSCCACFATLPGRFFACFACFATRPATCFTAR